MPSRQRAISRAEARFPAVAQHLLETHGLLLPRHALYVAAFFFGLEDDERSAAWSLDAGGLLGIGQWFEDGALEKVAYADPRVHGRYRRDPPEMLTFVSGNSDGSHWGLWYDDPNELPRTCAHNWARDSAETGAGEATLLASIHARAIQSEEPRRSPADRKVRAWLEELLPLERRAHDGEKIPDPPARTRMVLGGMDPVGVALPTDLFFMAREPARAAAYRAHAPEVAAGIATAKRELAAGQPARALFLGRELHWLDDDTYRADATALLAGAYRALGRDALAEITLAHDAARDVPTVDAYTVSSGALYLAAVRGDAATVAHELEGPKATVQAVRAAARRARSTEVRERLFARDPSAIDEALSGAIERASPRFRKDHFEAAPVLRESRARGESHEDLLARLLREQRYATWRVIRDDAEDLDPAAWSADVDALTARALGASRPIEPIVVAMIAAHLFDAARPLLARVDPAWRAPDGSTLLHVAASVGAVEIAERLLAKGADPAALDHRARTPRDLAKTLWEQSPDVGSRMMALVRPPEAPPPPPPPVGVGPIVAGERVVHAKFGEGLVTAADAGKLTIQFADATRTLLERFVQRPS